MILLDYGHVPPAKAVTSIVNLDRTMVMLSDIDYVCICVSEQVCSVAAGGFLDIDASSVGWLRQEAISGSKKTVYAEAASQMPASWHGIGI